MVESIRVLGGTVVVGGKKFGRCVVSHKDGTIVSVTAPTMDRALSLLGSLSGLAGSPMFVTDPLEAPVRVKRQYRKRAKPVVITTSIAERKAIAVAKARKARKVTKPAKADAAATE